MKILVVCQYYHPEPFRVSKFCSLLQSQGHEVTVLTGMPNYPEGRFYSDYGYFGPMQEKGPDGIKVLRVPLIPRGNGGKIPLVLNYLSFAFCASFRSLFLLPRQFDMVFVYQLSPVTMALPGILFAKLKRIPLVLYSLDIWPDSIAATGVKLPAILQRMIDNLSSYIYRQPSRLLVSSQGFIARMVEMGVFPNRLHYWPQSTDEIFSETEMNNADSIREKIPTGFVIMFAGNIGVAQGFGTILDTAEKLRDLSDLHWVVLGDGRMRNWVETEVQARGLHNNFHLLGRYPAKEMPAWYSMADSLLVSLKKDPVFSLTLPAKVQSYLASGRPILAAMDGEGAKVVLEANAGYSCSSDDPDGLAAIVRKMLALPKAEREQMGKNGAEYASQYFNQYKLMQELDMIISSVVREESSNKGE